MDISNYSYTDNDYVTGWGCQVDEHDNPVKRTKITHPYSYDGFVQERVFPKGESTATVYSDRLLQWDYKKTRRLQLKHFKDTGIDVGGDGYSSRSAKSIQGFLREWFDDDTIVVCLVMEYCNVSSGYPLWRFDYKHDES